MKKDFLKILDFTGAELMEFIDLGLQLKKENKEHIPHKLLEGKTIGLIFQKSSTRTRVSFEVGMVQLGGYPMFLSSNDLQLGRGESIQDTARVLSRYLDGIMIRTFEQSMVETLAQYATIPVINGLTDEAHPCQILADLMTVKEYKGKLEGLKVGFIGDGNNVCNSYIVAALKLGMQFTLACPVGYEPHPAVVEFVKTNPGFELVRTPEAAAKGADVIVTDVWTSMGQEKEQQKRLQDFQGYLIDEKMMALTNPGCMVQHCLPAHKGEEISEAVFEAHADEIFTEAENRMHVQKAIMVKLMGNQ